MTEKKTAKKTASGARAPAAKTKVVAKAPAKKTALAKAAKAGKAPATEKAAKAPAASKRPGAPHMSLAEVRAAAAAKAAAAKAEGRRAKARKTPAERMAAPVRKQASKIKAKPTIRKKIAAKMADAAAERAVEAQKAPEPFFKPPAKKTVRFSAADLEDFRKELVYMRKRIVAKIKSDNQASFKREDESHHTEESTEAYDRFFAIETSGSFQEIIYHIDEALNSIKEGTYGICKNCGGLIQKPRLQALPFAKNCIRCQALLERRQ